MRALGHALRTKSKELSITIQASEDDDVITSLAGAADYIIPMAYDEHAMAKVPGAVASAGFVERTLRRFSALVPASKLVLGVGARVAEDVAQLTLEPAALCLAFADPRHQAHLLSAMDCLDQFVDIARRPPAVRLARTDEALFGWA